MSLLRADTIKPVTSSGDLSLQGDSGGSAVDCLNITSAGDINFTGNTDAKIKLPSAGGIYESDGSTAILTESGGAVTLDNVALGSSVTGGGLSIKAWINANGTGTVATNASYNATLSDLGTGNYLITFASAISDANYAAVGMGCIDDVSASVGYALGIKTTSGAIDQKTTSVLEVMSKNQSGSPADLVSINVAILR